QKEPNGTWWPWENFGGGGTDITTGHNADGRLVVIGTNESSINHRHQTAAGPPWSDWAQLGRNSPGIIA
ncbi:hypothetical protein AB0I81_63725, partial [Nonomuraea sp. NPDC050404]|uniref:hypothetical protein n=1 Tax=Nonomuraea sp. NPDC050404 TaxID=3155783 RepID=UPI0033E5FBDF